MTARGELTGREAQAVDTASLLRLAAEAAGTLQREFRFSLLCPAETFFPNAGDEQVLLQGVVDAWFETKDGLVIVDYKTDRIRPEGVPARTAYYAAQLHAYAGAMARITSRSAAACCIFCTAARSATCRARMRKKMRKPLAILSPVC